MDTQTEVLTAPTDLTSATQPFRRAAVLGAGVMGAQIALHLANAGLTVDLLDLPAKSGDRNATVKKLFAAALKLKPNPVFTADVATRVRLGNFDDDFDRLKTADWIIEVVVERLDIKQSMMARIESVARPDAVIATNTSGLPIHLISEGRSDAFRHRFLGTHFFNPPRYLKLLELIPTPDTDPAVLERVAHFGRVHLGKGVVVAKDTPNFIGNRIGVYSVMQAVKSVADGGYTIEEIDALTGPLVGRPRSATFRTADVVGLDTLLYVADNLYKAVPDDESREMFQPPALMRTLVERGALGEKTKSGFYKKEGKQILSIDPAAGTYTAAKPMELGDLDAFRKAGELPARLNALYDDQGRAGKFLKAHVLDLLGYAARRLPAISDSPADVDKAIRWGFGWRMGPFETWDALGVERVVADLKAANIALPDWIGEMISSGATTFYRGTGSAREVYRPGVGYTPDPRPADEFVLATIKTEQNRTLWQNSEAALLDLGDGVGLYEFRSKANTLSQAVVEGLFEVLDRVESSADLVGLVIGNDGENFSVGANLGEIAQVAMMGQFDQIERMVARFQALNQRIRYAAKPVVVAVQGKVLGGGCEIVMSSPNPVAAAESYIGLVELGVGLIPAGCGTMRLAARASERAASGFPSNVQQGLRVAFETVANAKVAASAREAIELGFLPDSTRVVMNADRRLFVAKQEVLRLATEGYLAPPERLAIQVVGKPGAAQFAIAARQFRDGRYISEYDEFLANRFAYVLTGGEMSGPTMVPEQYLLDLELQVFMSLLGQSKTQERITGLLLSGKPVRN